MWTAVSHSRDFDNSFVRARRIKMPGYHPPAGPSHGGSDTTSLLCVCSLFHRGRLSVGRVMNLPYVSHLLTFYLPSIFTTLEVLRLGVCIKQNLWLWCPVYQYIYYITSWEGPGDVLILWLAWASVLHTCSVGWLAVFPISLHFNVDGGKCWNHLVCIHVQFAFLAIRLYVDIVAVSTLSLKSLSLKHYVQ